MLAPDLIAHLTLGFAFTGYVLHALNDSTKPGLCILFHKYLQS